jgi:hypothetical protein
VAGRLPLAGVRLVIPYTVLPCVAGLVSYGRVPAAAPRARHVWSTDHPCRAHHATLPRLVNGNMFAQLTTGAAHLTAEPAPVSSSSARARVVANNRSRPS